MHHTVIEHRIGPDGTCRCCQKTETQIMARVVPMFREEN